MSWFSREKSSEEVLIDGLEKSLKNDHSKWLMANNKSSILITDIDSKDEDKPKLELSECGQIIYWIATREKNDDGSIKFKSTDILLTPKLLKRTKRLYRDFLTERALRLIEKVENTK